MNPTMNEATGQFVAGRSVEELSTTAGLVVVGLLAVVLLTRELLRAADRPGVVERVRVLDIVALPLLVALASLVIARFATAL